jgi:hypothetical protein
MQQNESAGGGSETAGEKAGAGAGEMENAGAGGNAGEYRNRELSGGKDSSEGIAGSGGTNTAGSGSKTKRGREDTADNNIEDSSGVSDIKNPPNPPLVKGGKVLEEKIVELQMELSKLKPEADKWRVHFDKKKSGIKKTLGERWKDSYEALPLADLEELADELSGARIDIETSRAGRSARAGISQTQTTEEKLGGIYKSK